MAKVTDRFLRQFKHKHISSQHLRDALKEHGYRVGFDSYSVHLDVPGDAQGLVLDIISSKSKSLVELLKALTSDNSTRVEDSL